MINIDRTEIGHDVGDLGRSGCGEELEVVEIGRPDLPTCREWTIIHCP